MESVPPFIPRGRDLDTDYFPKANAEDEELKSIINDKKQQNSKDEERFNKFDTVCVASLQNINKKEAQKAIDRKKK